MSVQLDPNGHPIRVSEDVSLVTPGLRGTASSIPAARRGLRGGPLTGDPLSEALAGQDVETQHVIEIEDTQELPGGAAVRGRGGPRGEDAIELKVRPPPEGWEQFVLSQDESDIITWHFGTAARDDAAGPATRGGPAPTRTYLIPRRVAPAPQGAGTRGILTTLGKKVLRVVGFKVAGP